MSSHQSSSRDDDDDDGVDVVACPTATGSTYGSVSTISCVFCHASVHFVGIPANRYKEHLFREHNILYDVDTVVDRTLQEQGKKPSDSKTFSEAGVQVNFASLPPVPLDRWFGLKRKREPISKSEGDVPNVPRITRRSESLKTEVEEDRHRSKRRKVSIPWHSGCENECRVCFTMFYCADELRVHVRKDHGSVDDYLERHEKFETRVVWMKCRICSEPVKRNYSSIRRHLWNQHAGMTPEGYGIKFGLADYEVKNSEEQDATKEEKPPTDEMSEEEDGNSEPIMSSEEPESSQAEGKEKVEAVNFEDWKAGKCKFQCGICSFSTNNSVDFWKHSESQHSLEVNEYKAQHGNPCVTTFKIECPICFKLVRHEEGSLNAHAVKAHALSLEKYFDVCIGRSGFDPTENSFLEWRDASMAKCALCQWKGTRTKFAYHIRKHNITMAKYKVKYGSALEATAIRHGCLVCGAKVVQSSGVLHAHFVLKHGLKSLNGYYEAFVVGDAQKRTKMLQESSSKGVKFTAAGQSSAEEMKRPNSVTDLERCEFSCQICKKLLTSYPKLRYHLKKYHKGVDRTKYAKRYGRAMTKKALYVCQICRKKVVHTRHYIYKHMMASHNMTLNEYYEKSLMKGTKDIPSMKGAKVIPSPAKELDSSSFTTVNVPWYSKSIFGCRICGHKVRTHTGISYHIVSTHDLKVKDYVSDYGSLMTDKQSITCLICKSRVTSSRLDVVSHLKQVHYISLDDYSSKFRDELERDSPSSSSDSLQVEKKEKEPAKDLGCGEEIMTHPKQPWFDQCSYECRVCQQSFVNYFDLASHITSNSKHKFASIGDYKAVHGPLMTERTLHKCRVSGCKGIISACKNSITLHLKNHELSLQNYSDKYISEVTSGNIEILSVSSGPEALQVEKELYRDEEKESEEETEFNPKQPWYDQCRYECRVCQHKLVNYFSMVSHITKHNFGSVRDYVAVHGPLMTERRLHKCHVKGCQTSITACRMSITQHLKSHKLLLKKYSDKYISEVKSGNIEILSVSSGPDALQVEKELYQNEEKESGEEIVSEQPWFDQCSYQCAVCQQRFVNYCSMASHITKHKFASVRDYVAVHGPLMTEKRSHACLVCRAVVTACKHSITTHLKIHKLSLQQYSEQYTSKSGSGNVDTRAVSFSPDLLPVEELDVNEKESVEDLLSDPQQPWYDQCQYECGLCNQRYSNYNALAFHVTCKHNFATISKYVSAHGPLMTKKISLQCRVCAANITACKNSVFHHLSTHKLSLGEYAAKYLSKDDTNAEENTVETDSTSGDDEIEAEHEIVTDPEQPWYDQCCYECLLCQHRMTNYNGMAAHVTNKHQFASIRDYVTAHGPLMTEKRLHRCHMCKSIITASKQSISVHLAIHNLTLKKYADKFITDSGFENIEMQSVNAKNIIQTPFKTWLEQCVYDCRLCEYSCRTRRLFKTHLDGHEMDWSEYTSEYGSLPSTVVWHCCHICGKDVKQERDILSAHMSQVHHGRTTVKKYFEQYVRQSYDDEQQTAEEEEEIILEEDDEAFCYLSQNQFTDRAWMSREASVQCKICDASQPRDDFESHLKGAHDTDLNLYQLLNGAPSLAYGVYRCFICSETVPHREEHIAQHLLNIHGLSPEEYLEENEGGEAPSVRNDTDIVEGDTKYDWNQCFWHCHLCSRYFPCTSLLSDHYWSEHSAQGLEQRPNVEDIMQTHQCRLCGNSVLVTAKQFSAHLSRDHSGMEIEKYERSFAEELEQEFHVFAQKNPAKGQRTVLHVEVKLEKAD